MDILSQSEIDNLLKKLLQDTSVLPDTSGSAISGAGSNTGSNQVATSFA